MTVIEFTFCFFLLLGEYVGHNNKMLDQNGHLVHYMLWLFEFLDLLQ